jgi:hypothetical protein
MFAVYKLVVEDTNQLSSRRQMLDNLCVTIIALVLGADAYIAANSRLLDWNLGSHRTAYSTRNSPVSWLLSPQHTNASRNCPHR